MKVTKDAKVKLERGDVRLGNFVVHEENGFYKIQDINSAAVLRLNKMSVGGRTVGLALESNRKFLEVWITMTFMYLNTVPDNEFMQAVIRSCTECIERQRHIYGGPVGEPSEEEQEKVLDGERSRHEAYGGDDVSGEA